LGGRVHIDNKAVFIQGYGPMVMTCTPLAPRRAASTRIIAAEAADI
jgi:hypothetical protein